MLIAKDIYSVKKMADQCDSKFENDDSHWIFAAEEDE